MNSIKTYVEGKSLKVFFIISYQGKRFQVYTGITSTVKFSGMVFPKSVPNARAKTAMLARLFASVEEYVYMNTDLPIARMKDEIKAIINGRTASVEKNILYYIDEFIKTKAKDSTKEIFLRTRKRIESFDEHADFDSIDRDWLERFQAHELLKGRISGGIAIDLRNIRTVFNWAIDNEITSPTCSNFLLTASREGASSTSATRPAGSTTSRLSRKQWKSSRNIRERTIFCASWMTERRNQASEER